MKKTLIISYVVSLYFLGGTSQAELLGRFSMWARTETSVVTDHIELWIRMRNSSGSFTTSFLWPGTIYEDLDEHLYHADKSMEGFNGIAYMLTNGYNDEFFVMQNIGGDITGGGDNEERFYQYPIFGEKYVTNNAPDLYGYEVKRIDLDMSYFDIEVLRTNPDGTPSMMSYEYELDFYFHDEPIPEPCSLSLLALGAFFAGRKRRK